MSNGSRPGEPSAVRGPAQDLNWLLADFVQRTLGVTEAVAVSSDGFLLAASSGRERPGIEQLAAIIAGLTSLTAGAADIYAYGNVNQVIVEMEEGYFFVMSISEGSTVGVLADRASDVGLVGYEMALIGERIGTVLTPALIDELRNSLTTQPRRR